LKPPGGITWGIASVITFMLLFFAILMGWCLVWYVKGYIEKGLEMEIKERIELQERREYFIENPLVPADELPVVVEEKPHDHGPGTHQH